MMKISHPIALSFFVASAISLSACGGDDEPPVFDSSAVPQVVSSAGLFFAEGVVADQSGKLYASDLTPTAFVTPNPGGTIYRYDPATGTTSKFLEPSGMSNGLHVDRGGDLLIAQGADTGGRSIQRMKLSTGSMTTVVNSYQGKPLNAVNDLTSDSAGRIYFTDAWYLGADTPQLPNAVYRVDPNGTLVRLSTDVFRPNGIEVSPDGRRLYVAAFNDSTGLPVNPNGPATDTFGLTFGGVVVYDLAADGSISNGRVFYRNNTLGVDGMAMDTEGNLYMALHNGNPAAPQGKVVVLSAQGTSLGEVTLPGGAMPSNVGFGRGADCRSLYITTAFQWKLYKLPVNRCGFYQ